ncbi:MAG: hypothetical protein KKA55_07940 [Proteobacteria bacterium]|nr:hypothetical protein [Pseudomonadota bacterium]MBU1595449.1 hypothetical protein [Pseudomonadota bacterium]
MSGHGRGKRGTSNQGGLEMTPTRYQLRFLHHKRLTLEEQIEQYQHMHKNSETDWDLGVIPWYGWRMQLMKHLLYASEYFNGEPLSDDVLDLVNDSMLNAKVDIRKLPTHADEIRLMQQIKRILDEEGCEIIQSIFDRTLLRLDVKDDTVARRDPLRNPEKYTQEWKSRIYLDTNVYFHCRVLCESLKILLARKILNEELLQFITLHACECIATNPLCAQDYFFIRRLKVSRDDLQIIIYNFWEWQYLQRNQEYRKMLAAYPFRNDGSATIVIAEQLDLFEHFELSEVDLTENLQTAGHYKCLNRYVRSCITRFGVKPTWRIFGYTSEVILRRMIQGSFRYYERESPTRINFKKEKIFACSHTPSECWRFKNSRPSPFPNTLSIRTCDPSCWQKKSKTEIGRIHEVIHRSRPKIRKEGLRRMLGLLIWDYCQQHNVKSVESAIKAVTTVIFPEKNPGWEPSDVNEAKDGETWDDYRLRLLDERQLYHDYEEACRCIEAVEFLPKRKV